MRVKELGPRQWKKDSGYQRQARVENTFFRYKAITLAIGFVLVIRNHSEGRP